jgi:serine/threonine protein kinase
MRVYSSHQRITPNNCEIVKKKRRVFTDCYELGEEIGKGGFGVVHLATDKETGEKFAVKIIKITDKNHRSVLNEVRVHAKMRDTDLVARLQDVFYSRENLYLVMVNNPPLVPSSPSTAPIDRVCRHIQGTFRSIK